MHHQDIILKIVFLISCLLSSLLQGQVDHPLVSRFPDSEIVEVDFVEDANYRIVLGTLQRTRGVVTPESSQLLRGDITKIRYEVSQAFSGQDVFAFFKDQFAEKGYTELFTCSGRECGSSNYWANDIFRNRVLYGPERNQYFMALRSGEVHLVLYIITRGNRRLYTYLEIVEQEGTVPKVNIPNPSLLDSIAETGSTIVPDLTFLNDRQLVESQALDNLAAELMANPELLLYVVAHLGGEQPLDELLNRSMLRAQTVRQRLIMLGVEADRLTARGVGPLAPSCAGSDCESRVELVLH